MFHLLKACGSQDCQCDQTWSTEVLFMRDINHSNTAGCNANLPFVYEAFYKKYNTPETF